MTLCNWRLCSSEHLCNCLCIPRSSVWQKLQVLEQLWNGNSTRKFPDAIGMSQSWVVRLRKEIVGELERQKGERPRHLTTRERQRCVTLLTEGRLGVASKVAAEI